MAKGDITNITLTEATTTDKVNVEAAARILGDNAAEADIDTDLIDLDADSKNKSDRVKEIIDSNVANRDQMVQDRKDTYGEDTLDIKTGEFLDENDIQFTPSMTEVLNVRAISYNGMNSTLDSLTSSNDIETDYNTVNDAEPALATKMADIMNGSDTSADTFKELNDKITVLDTGDIYDTNTILGFKTSYNKQIKKLADEGIQEPGKCLVYGDENTKKYYELYVRDGDIELKEVFNPNSDLVSSFLETQTFTISDSYITNNINRDLVHIIPFSEYGVLLYLGNFNSSNDYNKVYVIHDIRNSTTFSELHSLQNLDDGSDFTITSIEVLPEINKVLFAQSRFNGREGDTVVDRTGRVTVFEINPDNNRLEYSNYLNSGDYISDERFGQQILVAENCSYYGVRSDRGRGRFYIYNKNSNVLATTILPKTDDDSIQRVLLTEKYAYTFENNDTTTINKYDLNDNFNFINSQTIDGTVVEVRYVNGQIFVYMIGDEITQIFDEEFVKITDIDYKFDKHTSVKKFSDTKISISQLINTDKSYLFDQEGYELYSGGVSDIVANSNNTLYTQLLGTTTVDASSLNAPLPIVGLLSNPIYKNR